MRRFLAILASGLGFSVPIPSAAETVDPNMFYFSVSTLNDALPQVDTTIKRGEKDLLIHEDDWRQFEIVSLSCDAEMKEEIAGVQRILKEKSKPSGNYLIFSEVYVRKLIIQPLPKPLAWTELLSAVGVQPSSVFRVGLRDGQGMIKGGFSFRVGQLTIYGIRQDEKVHTLCFDLTRTPSLGDEEAKKLAAFFEKSGVVLIHWPSATVLADKQAVTNYLQQKSEKKP